MESIHRFKIGDSVTYMNGMDFQEFTGVVESIENKKGVKEYLVKDSKTNAIKRVAERFLVPSVPIVEPSKFNMGDFVSYRNEIEPLRYYGTVERCINNYKGKWEYLVKDAKSNEIKRVSEKALELAPNFNSKSR